MREAFRLYKKHFPALLLVLLVQLILRAMALTPLMFLLSESLAPLALLAIPAYLMIVLPARQNVALALQEMLCGGSPFTVTLLETRGYWGKLWRGLKGTLCILLWSLVTLGSIAALWMSYEGIGGLDGFTLLRTFKQVGGWVGGTTIEGALLILGGIALTAVLILLGCGLHAGTRHAVAMGDQRLLKGKRSKILGQWMLSLVLLIPFVAVIAGTMGGWLLGAVQQFTKTLKLGDMAISPVQIGVMAAAVVVLLLPVIPLRTILPAAILHEENANDEA